jgi:hypothetical protein
VSGHGGTALLASCGTFACGSTLIFNCSPLWLPSFMLTIAGHLSTRAWHERIVTCVLVLAVRRPRMESGTAIVFSTLGGPSWKLEIGARLRAWIKQLDCHGRCCCTAAVTTVIPFWLCCPSTSPAVDPLYPKGDDKPHDLHNRSTTRWTRGLLSP